MYVLYFTYNNPWGRCDLKGDAQRVGGFDGAHSDDQSDGHNGGDCGSHSGGHSGGQFRQP